MKIVCRSGNTYDLKMKFSRYQELQKAVRSATKGAQKYARTLKKSEADEDVNEVELERAEAALADLQDELEATVLPFVEEALRNSGVIMDDIEEPEDIADMVARLLGSAPPGAPNPLAVSPDSTPTG